jgi:hypothetical protein
MPNISSPLPVNTGAGDIDDGFDRLREGNWVRQVVVFE